jgi:hypothetical protein
MTSLSLACVAACVFFNSGSAQAATIAIDSGVLSVAGGGLLNGPGGWSAASLSYDVSFDDVSLSYFYNYTFTGTSPVKNISHVITQVSSNFTTSDVLGGTTAFGAADGLGTWGPQGGSNTGIPGTITGIKYHPVSTPEFSWTIETARAPMWGNFYAKDGVNKVNGVNQPVYVYNAGFVDAMGINPPACYTGLYFDFSTCAGFLLVPDSVEQPPVITSTPPITGSEVPEPMSLVLFGTGLATIAATARRRFTRRS